MEETGEKKSKLPIIIAILVLVVIIAAVGGYFAYQYIEKNKTTGTEWGDTYYSYLKSAVNKDSNKEDYGLKDNMENTKLQFIEVGETNPIMVMTYDYEGDSFVTIYRTQGENKVDKIIHQEPASVEFLYHIQSNSYSWYIHEKNETQDSYKKIYTILENPEKNKEAEYTIMQGEETSQDTRSGSTITLSKFDEIFVEPEIEPSKKIDFREDMELQDLKNEITTGVEGYKSQEQLVTEEIKTATENKVKEVEETKQAIETAKEEIRLEEERKAEEEAKRRQEEAKKKAEEEANKKISEEEAKKLAQKIDGTVAEETGFPIGYGLEAMVKDSSGLEYYLFRVRWLVENSHWSTIDGIAISVNGKKWKQIDIYQNYQDGQTIKEVYKEGNF